MAKIETGDWKLYRARFGLSPDDEVDLHFGPRERGVSYDEAMADVRQLVENSLRKAQENGRAYVMFVHGWSTSHPGQTTARSMVRGFMRSKEATSFVERAKCIQHETAFVAKIRKAKA
jgi:DNA-nicking Smr family endonuclease